MDDKGIQCEGECQYWYHCACLGISDGEYDCLAASDSKQECSKCSSADLPVLNSVDAVDVFHFDFQKKPAYSKTNCGATILFEAVVDLYFQDLFSMMAYMWHELLAKRGPNDVASCLSHFIFQTPLGRTGTKWSIWWADNCPGQNKNNALSCGFFKT